MSKKMPSVRLNAVLNSFRTIMSIIFPLITYPYVTRLLQAENLGKVNFASSTMSYFSLIAVLGLTSYASREGVKYRDDKRRLNQFCSELLTLNLCTTVVAYILLIIVVIFTEKLHSYIGLLAIYSITILFSTLGMEWLYALHEDYLYITIRSVITQIVSLILMLALVRSKNDFYIYAAINVFASVGGNIFNFVHSKKYIMLKLTFNKKIFRHLRYSIIFFSSSLASSIYSNIDTTMLGFMCGEYNVGIYSVAVKIFSMVRSVLAAVMTVTSPRLTYYKMNNMSDDFNHMASKLIKTMLTVMLPVVVGINLTAKEIIMLIAGKGYEESQMPLRILSLALFAAIFASITSNILVASRKEKVVLKGTVTAAIVNLVANCFIIPIYKQNGAAFTTAVSELTVFLIGFWNSRNLVRIENVSKVLITSASGCFGMLGVAYGIEQMRVNLFITLILKVSCCVVVYGVILLLFRNEIADEYAKQILDRFKK